MFLCLPRNLCADIYKTVFMFFSGVALVPAESMQEVYDGIWGYNAVIATASITCVFFAFNTMSFVARDAYPGYTKGSKKFSRAIFYFRYL